MALNLNVDKLQGSSSATSGGQLQGANKSGATIALPSVGGGFNLPSWAKWALLGAGIVGLVLWYSRKRG